MILAEGASFVATWTHPSLKNAVNTALSLDHLSAEGFLELITIAIGRVWLKRHDRKHHTCPRCKTKVPNGAAFGEVPIHGK